MNTILNFIKNKKVRNWGILVASLLVIGALVWLLLFSKDKHGRPLIQKLLLSR